MQKYNEVPECVNIRPTDYRKKCEFVMKKALDANGLDIADMLWKSWWASGIENWDIFLLFYYFFLSNVGVAFKILELFVWS